MRSVLESRLVNIWPRGILPPRLRIKLYGLLRQVFLSRLPKHSIGAEIGVWMGDFTEQILSVVDPQQLHIIDPWVSQPQADDDLYRIQQLQMDLIYERVADRFAGDDRVVLHRTLSEEAARDFTDGSLDWVYIDGNHSYEFVKKDLELYLPKLKSGGLLTGDDHLWRPDLGYPVKRAVDEMIESGRVEKEWIRRSQFILRKPSGRPP
jgi:hypothetical protein